jgi:voltage-gated potassium channel
MIIEGWNLLDSLYMVIITLATVGYKEVRELSPVGQIYTMPLILSGTGLLAYAVTNLSIILVEGKLLERLYPLSYRNY